MLYSKQIAFLGIDTSCYTTSVALLNQNMECVAQCKQLLPVKTGQVGLRQSEMVFHHVKALPVLLEKIDFSKVEVVAVGVSDQPRALQDSYMPAFLAGVGVAQSVSSVLNVPLYRLSHQQNHLLAAVWSAQMPSMPRYLFVHISGGTTELLVVREMGMELVAETADISAGQFVDRVGVRLGLSFPCGPQLESLASTSKGDYKNILPIARKKGVLSFAGPCSAAFRLLEAEQVERADLAQAVLYCVAESLLRKIQEVAELQGVDTVLVAGGVASNLYIKDYLQQNLQRKNIRAFFAQPQYSADNAMGCAIHAGNEWANDRKNLHR